MHLLDVSIMYGPWHEQQATTYPLGQPAVLEFEVCCLQVILPDDDPFSPFSPKW